MPDMNENFDEMSTADFEARLPELIASGPAELLSDPRLTVFFERNPDCSALVRDLAAIADAAKRLLQPEEEPEEEIEGDDIGADDPLWASIKGKLPV